MKRHHVLWLPHGHIIEIQWHINRGSINTSSMALPHGFVILHRGFLRFLAFVLIPLDSIWYISRANAIGSTSTKFATHQYPQYTPINMTDILNDPSGQITLNVVNSYFLGS